MKKKMLIIPALLTMALTMTACTDLAAAGETVKSFVNNTTSTATNKTESSNVSVVATSVSSDLIKDSDRYEDYTQKDYTTISCHGSSAEVTGSDAGNVTVSDGTITITAKGYYVLEGTFEGTVVINAPEDGKVHLVLNGVTITANDGPAILETSSDKLIIMLAPGTENTLSDSKAYTDTSEDAPTGAIYAKDDLTINGDGSLTVNGNYNDGIVSKDDLKIISGNVTVNATDDGLLGRDSLLVAGGTITVNAGGHGLKTTNDEDDDKGYAQILSGALNITAAVDGIHAVKDITVSDAFINISAGDDGIHTDTLLTVNSGTINITQCYEGLEGNYVVINDGTISIVASDDGINAAGGNDGSGFGGMFGKDSFFNKGEASASTDSSSEDTPYIAINGGNIYVNSLGDGLDANGNLEVNGGYVLVSGSTNDGNNATDYDGTFLVNGGTMIATGSFGMYQSISSGSTCPVIDYKTDSSIAAGTECTLYDGSTVVANFTVDKTAKAIMIAGDILENGKEYTLKIGSQSVNVTAAEGSGQGGFGGFGGFGGHGNFDGQMPDFQNGEKPDSQNGQMPDFQNGQMPDFQNGQMPTPPSGGQGKR